MCSAEGNCNVNYGLWVVALGDVGTSVVNKYTSLLGDVDSQGAYASVGLGGT